MKYYKRTQHTANMSLYNLLEFLARLCVFDALRPPELATQRIQFVDKYRTHEA